MTDAEMAEEIKGLIEIFRKATGVHILLPDDYKVALGPDIIDLICEALEQSLNPPGWGVAL